MGQRRVARECALQMLYEWDIGGNSIDEVLRTYWTISEHPSGVRTFAEELFSGVAGQLQEIDALIQRHAQNWRLGRMAAVDRNVLRLAVFELRSDGRNPDSVIINEAIEIARKFSTQDSAQFVNGILDSVRKELPAKASASTG